MAFALFSMVYLVVKSLVDALYCIEAMTVPKAVFEIYGDADEMNSKMSPSKQYSS